MSTDTCTPTDTKIAVRQDLKEPPQYKVIYVNDDTTSMEFVIESLTGIFKHTVERATELTYEIHEAGAAVVAVLPFEIAEQKGIETTTLARTNGYPLVVKVEPDE